MKELSIIIPCYNEEESIGLLKENLDGFLKEFKGEVQLVFVNDGSTDKTKELLQQTFQGYPNYKLINNVKNLNLGGAVKAGIKECDFTYTAVIDSDCSYSPKYLTEMFKKLSEGDFVTASAHHPDAHFAVKLPFYRLMLSRGVVWMYNILTLRLQYSYTSIFRIYKTSDLKSLNIVHNDFIAMTEIMIKLLKLNKRPVEFPAISNYRVFGVSKMKIKNTIKSHLVFMWAILLDNLKIKKL